MTHSIAEPWTEHAALVKEVLRDLDEHFSETSVEWTEDSWSGNNEHILLEVGRELEDEWRVAVGAQQDYAGHLVRDVVTSRHPDLRDIDGLGDWYGDEYEDLIDQFSEVVDLEVVITTAMNDLAREKMSAESLFDISPQVIAVDGECISLDWGGYAETLGDAADMLLRCQDALTCYLDDYGPDLPWSHHKGLYSAIWDALTESTRDDVAKLLLAGRAPASE